MRIGKLTFIGLISICAISIITGLFIAISNYTTKSSAQTGNYPMDVINSKNWKLTLPIGSPTEIKVGATPDLMTYTDEWFRLNTDKNGTVFKVRTDGATTSGSDNPRSELREMKDDGKNSASWSSTSGTHSMIVEQSVDVLPIGTKPVVVAGQIHDSDDDITVIRVEGNTYNSNTGDKALNSIWITNGDTAHGYLVTNSYKLGDKFSIGFKVSNGKINYVYNGQDLSYSKSKSFSGAYFKAGAYNQSGGNCTTLTSGSDVGKCDYAQVTIYNLQVCHDGTCTGNASSTGGGIITPTEPPVVTPPTTTPIVITDDTYDVKFANLKTNDYTKPTNLKWALITGTPTGIKLSWTAAPGEADAKILGYKIYEKTSTVDYKYILISTDVNTLVTRPAGSYSYKVSAVYQNKDGSLVESKSPSSVSVTVK
jgi:hypothetical protein